MIRDHVKRRLQTVFGRIRQIAPGPVRDLSMKRWSEALASWLEGESVSVIKQCDKILARIDETGNFRNQEALLTRLLQPLSLHIPPLRNGKVKLVESAAWRTGYQGVGPVDLFSSSPNRVNPRECSSGTGLTKWAQSD